MSDTTQAVLLGVFTLATCVWVGGYVAIVGLLSLALIALGSLLAN